MKNSHLLRGAATATLPLAFCLTPVSRAAPPPLALEVVTEGQLLAPLGATHAGDGSGRLFVFEQRGRVWIVDASGALLPTPFLDVEAKLVPERPGFDERGLLGFAFHPDYSQAGSPGEGLFYVYYSAPSPAAPGTAEAPVDHRSVISEFRVSADPNLADAASERVLLTFEQPQFNHDAGQIAFGPDGMLYIATGDGGSGDDNNAGHTGGDALRPSGVLGNSQDRTNLLGKILRIDPSGNTAPGGAYAIPPDNPFVGAGGGVREEIFAYGLRNPWRFSFDDGPGGTGRLFCADVGQRDFEEVNIVTGGGNYGWRNREGSSVFDAAAPGVGPFIEPVAEYAHPGSEGTPLPRIGLSITGGFVYRGTSIPGLAGTYVFADWSSSFGQPAGTLLALEEHAGGFALAVLEVEGGNPLPFYIAGFGEDEAGELYVMAKRTLAPSATDPDTDQPTGAVFKLVAVAGGESGSVVLEPDRDGTLFSESGALANGAGRYLFSGRTNQGQLRRGLLHFDVAGAVPAGAQVDAAELTLRMNKTIAGASPVGLRRVNSDWGEGDSDASGEEGRGTAAQTGDATWTFARFDSQPWTAGGDVAAVDSASASVGPSGLYSWTSATLTADVQAFLDAPADNHGWALIGDEAGLTAKRYFSREEATAADRPMLKVDFTSPAPSRFEQWAAEHFEEGEAVDLGADLDGDLLNGVLEYAGDLDPKRADPAGALFDLVDGGGGGLVVRFLRDPRAEDLTYAVEVSEDGELWTTLVEVVGGAAVTTGAAVRSDFPVVGSPPLREVTVEVPPDTDRKLVRLALTRSED